MFKTENKKLFFFTLVILLAATLSTPYNPTIASSSSDQSEVAPLTQEQTMEMIRASTNVVFEESNSPLFDTTDEYKDFANYLADNGYTVSNVTIGPIDASALASADILIIPVPQNVYTGSELGAIETWVEDGGKLLLIGDWGGYGSVANELANRFEIECAGDAILDSDDLLAADDSQFYLDGALGRHSVAGNLANHRIMEDISRVDVFAASGILFQPVDAVNLMQTDNDGTAIWNSDSSDARGVPLMLVINGGTVDNGAVVTITDGNLWSNSTDWDNNGIMDFEQGDNKLLALNTIDYLANPTFGPKVVFDEAHSPLYTIDSVYKAFAGALRAHGYNVSTITAGTTIDASVLASIDILVIVVSQDPYTTSEVEAIETWVNNGGKLFLLSDNSNLGTDIWPIAERFGIKYEGDILSDTDDDINGNTYWIALDNDGVNENINHHFITQGIERIELYACDGIPNAPTDNITILKTDGDGTCDWNNGSDALNIPIMVALDGGIIGSGKVVVISECGSFTTSDTDSDGTINFYDSENELLALNTIKWLASSWTVQPKRINNILIYSDDYVVSAQFPLIALQNLGYDNYTWTYSFATFTTLLGSQSWDLVIINSNSYGTIDSVWDAAKTYVDAGGFLIIATWNIDAHSSHALWATMGGAWHHDTDLTAFSSEAYPVYWWDTSSPVLTTPNSVPDFTSLNRKEYDDPGDAMTVAAGGTGVAGYTESSTLGNSSIIVGTSGKTILNSFLIDQNRRDLDNDGKLDAVELWENEIASLVWVSIDLTSDKTEYDSGEEVTLTATVTTLLGVLIDGALVDFTVYLPDNSTYASDTDTTDSDGEATFTFTLENLETDDDGTWMAKAKTPETETTINFTVNVEETNWLLYAAIVAAVVFLLLLLVIIKKKRG
ncbi:MAG: DUF4350 domain-containing protein [Candidatus Wukongarchaeota archaeon]|nr:DUF4350 domain-containing protein [Candidatus Wukongarchaeota archaeon]